MLVKKDYFGYAEAYEKECHHKPFLKFMEENPPLDSYTLDIGQPSLMSDLINEKFGICCSVTGDDDLNYLYFDRESFDMVVCTEVLEHLLCPLNCVKFIYDSLKDEGTAYISVPHKRWVDSLLFSHCKRHFHEFVGKDLKHLLDEVGFEIVRFEKRTLFCPKFGIRPLIKLFTRSYFFAHSAAILMQSFLLNVKNILGTIPCLSSETRSRWLACWTGMRFFLSFLFPLNIFSYLGYLSSSMTSFSFSGELRPS